jgi:TonB family protein
MTTERKKTAHHNAPKRFIESFDNFCVGLVDLKHMRAMIAELLESDPQSGGAILITLDMALREGLIKASTYELLATDIDRATSEDEPTEWSEETREQLDEKRGSSHVSATDDTGYPNEKPGTSLPGTTTIDITPGATLKNRFTLLSHIGSGSMANVYEAIDQRKQEAGSVDPRLAIKVISKDFSAHANALETLQREALNSQGLVHPNVIRVFDFDWDGDRFFMTMELLDGQSLVDLLNESHFQPLPFSQASSIIKGVCQGLQYAHEQGVIHADIKPGNIFVSAAGQAKILDFGIARITNDGIEEDDSPVTGAHTPAYASCEVLEGAEPTEQDDIFALGCIAYRMLAGRRPFGGHTALDAERKHLQPLRIETLDRQQWQALKKSLAYRRADRTTNAGDFAAAFFKTAPGTQLTDKSRHEPDIAPVEFMPGGLPLWFGIPAITVLLIAIAAVLFWPEPTRSPIPQSKTVAPNSFFEPADTIRSPGSVVAQPMTETVMPPAAGPVELIIFAAAQIPPNIISTEPAIVLVDPQPEPPPAPDPAQTRIDELTILADNAMNGGRLLDPDDDNARLYITELNTLAPDAMEVQQRRTRLTELMLLEAMVAITDEDFDVATRWIAESRELGVPEETMQRFEAELQKARDARKARQTETLGAIFASATPAAILADPGIDFSNEQEAAATPETVTTYPEAGAGPMTGPGSLSLTMILPGALPNATANLADEVPTGETVDTTNQDIALSALEFRRFVEPKLPRRYASGRITGWVELRFRVTTNGRTDDIKVLAAEPDNLFEKTAIKAVSKWRFKPVYVDGVATEKYSSVRLRFEPE